MVAPRSLVSLLESLVPSDGTRSFAGWGITLVRQSATTESPNQGVLSSAICIVAQGAKRVLLEGSVFDYDEDHFIVSSVDVPVSYQLVRASADRPFLCVRFALDPVRIAPLVPRVFPDGLPSRVPTASIGVAAVDPGVADAAYRLVEALGDPRDQGVLAALTYDELLIRFLRSEAGVRLAQTAIVDSPAAGIARVIAWLQSHYSQAVRIEDLAALAHMSVSSFHQHFRAVTAQSPLQFQKAIRLQEARNLLLAGPLDVGSVASRVGYASQSQFTREYSRYFGQSPTKDVSMVRGQLVRVSA